MVLFPEIFIDLYIVTSVCFIFRNDITVLYTMLPSGDAKCNIMWKGIGIILSKMSIFLYKNIYIY